MQLQMQRNYSNDNDPGAEQSLQRKRKKVRCKGFTL